MFSNLNNNTKGIALAFIGFTCFAMADANAKLLTQDYDSSHIVGIVAIFSSSFCVLLSPFLGGLKKTLQSKRLRFHLGRGVLNAIISLLIVFSFSKLTLAGTYSMLFVSPFITVLLAMLFFGERTNKHDWIAVSAGFIGVLVILRPGVSDLNPYLLAPLAVAGLLSLLFLFARQLDKDEALVSFAFYPVCTNLVLITPIVLYYFGMPPLEDLYMFALQAILVVGGLIMTALAFRIAKASLISLIMYTDISWAIGFDYFLFEELPDTIAFIGTAIIIASGVYLILMSGASEKKKLKAG